MCSHCEDLFHLRTLVHHQWSCWLLLHRHLSRLFSPETVHDASEDPAVSTRYLTAPRISPPSGVSKCFRTMWDDLEEEFPETFNLSWGSTQTPVVHSAGTGLDTPPNTGGEQKNTGRCGIKHMSDDTDQYTVRAKHVAEDHHVSFRTVLSNTRHQGGWVVKQLCEKLQLFKVPESGFRVRLYSIESSHEDVWRVRECTWGYVHRQIQRERLCHGDLDRGRVARVMGTWTGVG